MQIYIYNGTTRHNVIGDILDNGTPLFSGGEDAELPIADSSYRFSEIMGDDNVVVNFSLPVWFEFPIGCRVNVENTEYTLFEIAKPTQQNRRWYDYSLTFEAPKKWLEHYKFRNHVDGRLNFTLTAQPQEFLDHICRNMNMREGGNEWTVGDCIVSTEKTQSFSHNTLLEALNAVAQLFETEWEIVGKTISLKKVEYNKDLPLGNSYNDGKGLTYGKGNGFLPSITRELSGEKAVDQLWVEGGDRNIDSSEYVINQQHSSKLRLPSNKTFVYIPSDGQPDSNGNISRGHIIKGADWLAMTQAQRNLYPDNLPVMTDIDGFGITRAKVHNNTFVKNFINNGYEESLESTDVYPHKVLYVATAECVDEEKRFWDITVKTADGSPIPNYNNCLIGGETVTMIFNSGMLAGKEFNIANQGTETQPIVIKNNKIKIQPADIDGIVMPDKPSAHGGTGYEPRVDDEFGIFHVMLPQQYVEEAEMELLLNACEYLYKHGDVEVQFSATFDPIWAKKNWEGIHGLIRLGGYVKYYDEDMTHGVSKLMRILSIKTYLNNPHSPEITLSNSSVSQSVSSELRKIPQNQVTARTELDEVVRQTQRSFRDASETTEGVKTLLEKYKDYFTEAIAPIAVQTMQALVGNKDLQMEFGLVDTTTISSRLRVDRWREITPLIQWNGTQLSVPAIVMRHLSYPESNDSTIQPTENAVNAYPYWDLSNALLSPEDDGMQYLYIEASKQAIASGNLGYLNQDAHWRLYSKARVDNNEIKHNNTHFFFEVGILNSNAAGTRSFSPLYGYTEISGGRIGTDMIRSKTGNMTIDLITGVITGVFNFVDGLISSQILIGDSNNPIAGINGDPYVYWAGKTGLIDYKILPYHPTPEHQWAELPIFSVSHNGTLRICDSKGHIVFGAYTAQNPDDPFAFYKSYASMFRAFIENEFECNCDGLFKAKLIVKDNTSGLDSLNANVIIENGKIKIPTKLYRNNVNWDCLYGYLPMLMCSFTLEYERNNKAYWCYIHDRAKSLDSSKQFYVGNPPSRLSTGKVKIQFSHSFKYSQDYMVVANGRGTGEYEEHPLSVTLLKREVQSITILMADDDSPNDGCADIKILAFRDIFD